MIKWKLTIVMAGVLWLASCTKEDMQAGTTRSLGEIDPDLPTTLATAWETAPAWTSGDSSGFRLYRFNRSLPQLTGDVIKSGAVSVWTKYARYNGAMGLDENPAQLPFYIYSENERPKFVEYWESTFSPGQVSIQYRTTAKPNTTNTIPNPKVQFRYVVIPADELAKRKLTRSDLDRMNYRQLVNAFGISE